MTLFWGGRRCWRGMCRDWSTWGQRWTNGWLSMLTCTVFGTGCTGWNRWCWAEHERSFLLNETMELRKEGFLTSETPKAALKGHCFFVVRIKSAPLRPRGYQVSHLHIKLNENSRLPNLFVRMSPLMEFFWAALYWMCSLARFFTMIYCRASGDSGGSSRLVAWQIGRNMLWKC